MKKLILIMMAIMASFGVYAQEVNTENENVEVASANETLLTTVYLTRSQVLSQSITITSPAPPENILSISGPTIPHVTDWAVSNGTLTIRYGVGDLSEIAIGGEFKIYVIGESYYNYVIRLIVN